ncbi:GGDEF domain-containing protein [Halomonas marinisediminis]|uniref:diguanylate cyclase n=1 Tax=Halomonas marinisediminis TaxID=2546095 RepID=A0ABY2D5M1_9GAMM|nr:sensor domain-containing diguanylate cyclase [Halomonas marinisediminis]TDB01973.1 diguanylate cyclase [Halomonas marinisediminis]
MEIQAADLARWWHLASFGQAVIDEQGMILQVNRTLGDWLGAPMRRLIDQPASELFTPEARMLYLGLLAYRVAEHGEAGEVHLTLRVKEGEPMPVLCSARLILHRGASLTLLSMLTIARKDRLERELLEARQATQRALAEKSAALAELESLHDTLSAQRAALEQTNQRLGQEALSDVLTGLPNRRRFDQALEAALAGPSATFSVAMLDIDHFKPVNDHHGHAAGDRVLQRLGELLSSQLRGDDLAARIGGEEFGLLMPAASLEAATCALERLRQAVEARPLEELAITLSIGVTQYRAGDTRETLMQRADDALYAAKRAGRNRIVSD